MKNITLAIPTYNSSRYIEEAFYYALNNDFISEILISDDCSEKDEFDNTKNIITELNNAKIKLIQTDKNLGGFKNKYYSTSNSSYDWVYLLDSDNHMTENTLDVIRSIDDLDANICYCPEKLILHKDGEPPYQEVVYDFEYEYIGLKEIKKLLSGNVQWVDWFLNTGNYFFNRQVYLNFLREKFDSEFDDTFAGDVIAMAYFWFKNGGRFKIVSGFHYYHRLRSDSYWMECGSNSNQSVEKYKNKILSL